MSRAERERHVSSRLHRGAAANMTPDGNPSRMVRYYITVTVLITGSLLDKVVLNG